MQSFLITGGNPQQRLSEAEKLIGKPINSLENNPDFILLVSKDASIGIDQVRQMQKVISLKPFVEKQKSCLIYEAQDLTPEAQNSLLKTLEEPPINCQIILTISNESLLLPTIISRCWVIFLNQKNKQIDENEKNILNQLLEELLVSSAGKRIVLLEKLAVTKNKLSANEWLENLIILLREKLLEKNLKTTKTSLETEEFLLILRLANHARHYLTLNANVRLVMENFLLDLPIKNQ